MTPFEQAIATLSTAIARRGINYNLDRLRIPLDKLGNPHLALPPCVHVAGTNGKGSTTTMIQTALTQFGYRVGTYTSPHITHYCERIAFDGVPISEAVFVAAFDRVWPLADAHGLSEFETLTLMGFLIFSEQRPDYVIVETGLGGRLDATNVIVPCLSIITSIGLDHQDILGPLLTDIAREKAGIIKPGVPALTAIQDPTIQSIFAQADPISPWKTLPKTMRLTGDYQRQNAALAEAAVQRLCPTISPESIQSALATAQIWGRWTRYKWGNQHIVIDGAHNSHGVAALTQTVRQQLGDTPLTLWMGMITSKNAKDAIAELPNAITVTYTYCPNGDKWHDLGGTLWNQTDALPPFDTPVLLITGSLYFIATLRPLFDTLEPL